MTQTDPTPDPEVDPTTGLPVDPDAEPLDRDPQPDPDQPDLEDE